MNNQNEMKKGNMSLLYIGIAAVIVIGGILWYANQNKTVAPTKEDTMMEQTTEVPTASAGAMAKDSMQTSDVKVINVKGSPFKFEPNEIRVKKGDKVKIVFMNEKGMHNWVNDEYNVKTKTIQTGETDSVEFTADKSGTSEYYCSVSNHKAMGMVGKLIVE